ncbi:hypothetical protein PHLGIDRAFT_349044 [Phlebiopsis gigantea 11061_1 CR5-6]|uniref:Uncharacterized protein n=1 Tax=Phlebiopsis gigantea (strain 11061_1 CR5-6) TaxID=745531 RepID=A0A0C3NAL6_PHLG1|nr:hypothetical protein PHLGIDRAFT_349044 [Phlebiopsis gigantea 11061_1 CR5-6]
MTHVTASPTLSCSRDSANSRSLATGYALVYHGKYNVNTRRNKPHSRGGKVELGLVLSAESARSLIDCKIKTLAATLCSPHTTPYLRSPRHSVNPSAPYLSIWLSRDYQPHQTRPRTTQGSRSKPLDGYLGVVRRRHRTSSIPKAADATILLKDTLTTARA